MRKKYWIFGCFILLALAQIVVSASRIVKWEDVLRTGKQYRFRTEPVDPYDAFRGRYVALGYEEETVPIELDIGLKRGSEVFALLEEDKDGFAQISRLDEVEPEGDNYLLVRVRWIDTRRDKEKVRLELPFDRFYMGEKAAPVAEKAYREHSRREKVDAYVTVRIKDGCGVLEELYVAGKPIKEFLRDQQEANKAD